MGIIYSKLEGTRDPLYGKFEKPIKAIIQDEANHREEDKTILKALYNVEKSHRFAETVMSEVGFDSFKYKGEGERAANLNAELGYKKTIEHIPFAGEFTITREMADDAQFGLGADLKRIPRAFVGSYYDTQVEIASWALYNGTTTGGKFNGSTVDLTTCDGLPLFHKAHTFTNAKGTQANRFYSSTAISASNIEKLLNILANRVRNFKDEKGKTMNYVADTIVVPCNRPELEMLIKKVCGSEGEVGSAFNAINTQYGNWTFVTLPGWETTDDKFMVMSSKANKNLMGNAFYNRVDLDIQNEVDIHTRNNIWNGYSRFGIGFNTWKHIALFETAQTSSVAEAITL